MDANEQAIAYVYGHADKRDAQTGNGLTLDEARRIASNIAKLPKLLLMTCYDSRYTVAIFPGFKYPSCCHS